MGEQETRAFTLAPLPWLVPLLGAIGVKAVAEGTGDGGYAGVFFAMLTFALLGYVATLLIGVPIHLLLRRFQKTGLIYYVSLAVLPFVLLAGTIAVWHHLAPARFRPSTRLVSSRMPATPSNGRWRLQPSRRCRLQPCGMRE